MKIPQGKQCRTHVLRVLQVPHPLSTCTEAQWLPVVLPLLYSAARLFALLVPRSFRQICLLMPLYILTQILLEQSTLKSKICKFNFKTKKYFTGRYLSTLKLPRYMVLLEMLCLPDPSLTEGPTRLFVGISKQLICLRP